MSQKTQYSGAVMYAADLTGEYVDFSKADVGDPGSLGGEPHSFLATNLCRV